MKISGRKSVSGPAPAAGRPGPKTDGGDKADKAESSGPSVDVTLSDVSMNIASAKAAVDAMPDVRAEKVSEVQGAVNEGSYEVENEEVARRMVDESLRESAMLTREKPEG